MFNMAAAKDSDSFTRQQLPVGLYNTDGLCPP